MMFYSAADGRTAGQKNNNNKNALEVNKKDIPIQARISIDKF